MDGRVPKRSLVLLWATLLAGCAVVSPTLPQAPEDSTPDRAVPDTLGFDSASLVPDFVHANGVWGGGALLDYDNDGWLDLFLSNGRSHPDALYRNNGDGTFEDVAVQAGVASTALHGAAAAGDVDNDGDTDLLVSGECSTGSWDRDGNGLADAHLWLHRNNGDGTFSTEDLADRIDDPGLRDALGHCTVSLLLADLDDDGFLDIFAAAGHDLDLAPPWVFEKESVEGGNYLLWSDGTGSWTDGTVFDDPLTTFAAVTLDVDEDGRRDLILGQAGHTVEVWRQVDHRVFEPAPARSESGAGLWMGLAVADLDHDGGPELYATNQGLSPLLQGYDNLYERVFELDSSYHDTGDTAQQLDGIHGPDAPVYPFHAVLDLQGGTWVRADTTLHAPGVLSGDAFVDPAHLYPEWSRPTDLARLPWSWGAAALDADADGWADIAFASNNCSPPMDIIGDVGRGAGPGGLFLNRGAGPLAFDDITESAGVALADTSGSWLDGRGVLTGDLNGDGYADYIVLHRSHNRSQVAAGEQVAGGARVWLSRPRDGHWLQVQLVGRRSNRDGRGGQVWLDTGDGPVWYGVGVGGGTTVGGSAVVVAGLGDATSVDVEVRFPSGEAVELVGVSADQILVVEEPSP